MGQQHWHGRSPRIALYSHDAQGLGHVRRNLAIADALHAMAPAPDTLVLTGAAEAASLPRPPSCDVVTLPGLAKGPAGEYRARHLTVPTPQLLGLRSAILAGALTSFQPDLLIVDRHPRGFRGELEPALNQLRGSAKVVLGLRDVLDEPARARAEWARDGASFALRKWFDEVWLYGDPAVYDLAADIDLAEDAIRVRHTGYLVRDGSGGGWTPTSPRRPYVLGLVGGGSDGAPVARAFAKATVPDGHDAVLVAGPQMPPDDVADLERIAATHGGLRIVRFTNDIESLLRDAAAYVCMGGYNSVCEVITRRPPTLIVPRVTPRREQEVRANRLAALGLVDVLSWDHLTPDAITAWLRAAVVRPVGSRAPVRTNGLAQLPTLATRLLAQHLVLAASRDEKHLIVGS